MADEYTDQSNREQLAICIRWLNEEREPQDVIGLYKIDDISNRTIMAVTKDTLIPMNLSISKCCVQCYNGASNMRGSKAGVAKKLLNDEPRALFIHCYGHALNLAAGDSIKKCKVSFCNFHVGEGGGPGGTGRGNKC